MGTYSIAGKTVSGSSASAALELIAGANVGYSLTELAISLAASTASDFGFGRPAAIGVTPTSPVTVLTEDGGNNAAGNSKAATAWGTGPTVPAAFARRVSLSGVVGAGAVFAFPNGFKVLKGQSAVLWNAAANGLVTYWAVLDE